MPDAISITSPREVNISTERLQRIAPTVRKYIDRQLIPGAVTLVARRGQVVHFEAQGYKNALEQKPMTTGTIFRIASMTKPITSVALMMLYEQGHLQLNDPISKWLPAFAQMQVAEETGAGGYRLVPAKGPIQVWHVLTHTAGFTSDYNPKNQDLYKAAKKFRSRRETVGDFVERLAQVPLNHHPGEVWDYSRATCVVGRLVEVISGQTLQDFFAEHIFEPLEMVDTHFFLPAEKIDRLSAAYQPGREGRVELLDPDTLQSFWLSKPGIYCTGSGGLLSTAADYFRFARMLMQNGRYDGGRLLSRKTLEMMLRNHTGDKPIWLTGPGYGFGLGFGITLDRGQAHTIETEGSYTWGGAYCTHWWNDPAEQLFGMILTQVRPNTHLHLRSDFRTAVYQAIDD